MNKKLWIFALALGATLVAVQETNAQARRYTPPSGPTISPNLNFFRTDRILDLDPFNAFVRPGRNLQQQLFRQNQNITQLRSSAIREVEVVPTGTSSRFRYYSHYYNMNRGGGRR